MNRPWSIHGMLKIRMTKQALPQDEHEQPLVRPRQPSSIM